MSISGNVSKTVTSLAKGRGLRPSGSRSAARGRVIDSLLVTANMPTVSGSSKVVLDLRFRRRFTLLILRPRMCMNYFTPRGTNFICRVRSEILKASSMTVGIDLGNVAPCRVSSLGCYTVIPPRTGTQIAKGCAAAGKESSAGVGVGCSNDSVALISKGYCALGIVDPMPNGKDVREGLCPKSFVFRGRVSEEVRMRPKGKVLRRSKGVCSCGGTVKVMVAYSPGEVASGGYGRGK